MLGFAACSFGLRAILRCVRSGGCPVRHAKRTNECVFYPDVVRPTARWPHHLCFGGFAESRPSGRSSCRGRTTFSLAASPNGRLGVLMAVVVFQLVKACDFPVFSAGPGVFDSTRASFEQQVGQGGRTIRVFCVRPSNDGSGKAVGQSGYLCPTLEWCVGQGGRAIRIFCVRPSNDRSGN